MLYRQYHKVKDEESGEVSYERSEPGHWMNVEAASVVDGFREARTVYQDPEEIRELALKLDEL